MTRARMISARIVLFAAATAFAARPSSPCTHPSRRAGAGHRLDDVRAALDRDVVHHHQEHAPGLEVQPVGHRARRARRFRRRVRDVQPPAAAFHLVPVVLHRGRGGLGQVGDLVGVPDAEVGGTGQVRAARAAPGREHIAGVVRVLVPFQVRARRAALLAGLAAAAAPGLRRRRCLPRQVIGTRRHPGVARVPGQEPLNAGEPLLQVRDLRVLVLQQHPQPLVRRPQPPVLRPQRGNLIRHTGGIGPIGHTWTTSEPAHREQHDTPSRPADFRATAPGFRSGN